MQEKQYRIVTVSAADENLLLDGANPDFFKRRDAFRHLFSFGIAY
jgi:hypothetical protein